MIVLSANWGCPKPGIIIVSNRVVSKKQISRAVHLTYFIVNMVNYVRDIPDKLLIVVYLLQNKNSSYRDQWECVL